VGDKNLFSMCAIAFNLKFDFGWVNLQPITIDVVLPTIRIPKSKMWQHAIQNRQSKIANLKSVMCTAAQSAVNDEDANRV
jgi:hypothetical protein